MRVRDVLPGSVRRCSSTGAPEPRGSAATETRESTVFLYIDATAGGVFIQVLFGGFAGVAMVGRLLWGRVLHRGRHRDTAENKTIVDAELATDDSAAEPDDAVA